MIKRMLQESGLTTLEAEVYIFLAKYEPLTATEIAKLIKKDKAQIYRVLKRLQTKQFVESTLEFPTRFIAVTFEKILNKIMKDKKDELLFIKKSKNELIEHFKKKKKSKPHFEKFQVIKGNKKIHSKIKQIVSNNQHQVSMIITGSKLLQLNGSDTFEELFNEGVKKSTQYRFLIEGTKQNVNILKTFIDAKTRKERNIEMKTPLFGIGQFPNIVIKDDEEILFFPTTLQKSKKDYECILTNCKTLVQTFASIFENLWQNSTDIQEHVFEIQKITSEPKTSVITDLKKAKKKYEEIIESVKNDVIIVTSSKGLAEFLRNEHIIDSLTKKDISIRIMAPIVNENFKVYEQLSKIFDVKHIPKNFPETIIIDQNHYFQYKTKSLNRDELVSTNNFEYAFYNCDLKYVKKTKFVLENLWKESLIPSPVNLDSIFKKMNDSTFPEKRELPLYFEKIKGLKVKKPKHLEKTSDVLKKIIDTKTFVRRTSSEKTMKVFGSMANAAIHPPAVFNLPEIVISAFHFEKHSALGYEDAMLIYMWLETKQGHGYVPVTYVGDNPKAQNIWKCWLSGTPAGQNVRLLKKDEIQIRIHGNTLFVGWTAQIPLLSPHYLPPSCLLIEGYGKIKTSNFMMCSPSGYRTEIERSGFNAFVTFLHPASKYSGPGTDGFFARDYVATTYPPECKIA